MKALIVDDSRMMRAVLRAILEEAGFSVTETGLPRAGLEALGGGDPPELVLLDWHLPEMTGLDFLRELKAKNLPRPPKVVLVTSESEVQAVRSALELGASEYVMKPFSKDVVLEKLAMIGFPASRP